MRVNFVLPRSANLPMGGYKMVFKYANEFADNYGVEVHIYFLINGNFRSFAGFKTWIAGLTFKHGTYRNISWFKFISDVHLHFDVFSKTINKISRGSVIATHWSTVNAVLSSKVSHANKFYLIQDYETFDPQAPKGAVDKTWQTSLKKIVVSKWLEKKAVELNAKPVHILTNFIDISEFPIRDEPLSLFERDTVSFLWHDNERKQSWMGLEIIERLHSEFPHLKFLTFGSTLPIDPPEYLSTIGNANPETLSKNVYGRSIVYFMPSRKEGWGLTGLEAMASGAVVVSVDNGGIHEYAVDGKSAIIVANSENKLLEAIKSVLINKELRLKIQKNGFQTARSFDMKKQTKLFYELLTQEEEWDDE